jgi:hypothetical protein
MSESAVDSFKRQSLPQRISSATANSLNSKSVQCSSTKEGSADRAPRKDDPPTAQFGVEFTMPVLDHEGNPVYGASIIWAASMGTVEGTDSSIYDRRLRLILADSKGQLVYETFIESNREQRFKAAFRNVSERNKYAMRRSDSKDDIRVAVDIFIDKEPVEGGTLRTALDTHVVPIRDFFIEILARIKTEYASAPNPVTIPYQLFDEISAKCGANWAPFLKDVVLVAKRLKTRSASKRVQIVALSPDSSGSRDEARRSRRLRRQVARSAPDYAERKLQAAERRKQDAESALEMADRHREEEVLLAEGARHWRAKREPMHTTPETELQDEQVAVATPPSSSQSPRSSVRSFIKSSSKWLSSRIRSNKSK